MINSIYFLNLALGFLTFGHWQDYGTLHAYDLISDIITVWIYLSEVYPCERLDICVTLNLNNERAPSRCPLVLCILAEPSEQIIATCYTYSFDMSILTVHKVLCPHCGQHGDMS